MRSRRDFLALSAAAPFLAPDLAQAVQDGSAASALVTGKIGVPLVVIDCYEHAFYVDYKNKKGDYVSAYPTFIDWAEVERRVKAAK